MAENVTTLQEIREKQAESDIALSDLLYLVKGTGSDRDRAQTLEELRDFLGNNLKNINISYQDQYQNKQVEIDEDGITGSLYSGSWSLSFSLTNEGLILKDVSSDTEYKIGLKELGAVLPAITSQNITTSKLSTSEITSEGSSISVDKPVSFSKEVTGVNGYFDALLAKKEISEQTDFYRIASDIIALHKAGQTSFTVSWDDDVSGFVVNAGDVNASNALRVGKYVLIQKGEDDQIGGIWFSNSAGGQGNRSGSIYLDSTGQIHINSHQGCGIELDQVIGGKIGTTGGNDKVKLIQRHYEPQNNSDSVTIKLDDGESCFIHVGSDDTNQSITVICGDITKKISHTIGYNRVYFVHRFGDELFYSVMN